MNTFKQTFYKYKFVNFIVILFYTFIQMLSIFLFPRWLYGAGKSGYPFNPYLFSGGLGFLGVVIILLCANASLSQQNKNKKIVCFIGIIIGIIPLVLGIYQEICTFIQLPQDFNSYEWSQNVVIGTRENNIIPFFFIAPIFCYLIFLIASLLYIKELIKVHKQNNQQQIDTTTE